MPSGILFKFETFKHSIQFPLSNLVLLVSNRCGQPEHVYVAVGYIYKYIHVIEVYS